jgi:hypothetical protein
LVGYVHRRYGLPSASTAPLAKITDAFSLAVHRFARDNGIPWVDFVKGQRKDDVMREGAAVTTTPQGPPAFTCLGGPRCSQPAVEAHLPVRIGLVRSGIVMTHADELRDGKGDFHRVGHDGSRRSW